MHKVILICGALAAAMLVTANEPARSQDKGSSIGWSETLPAGLDPHAVLDVPMQFILLMPMTASIATEATRPTLFRGSLKATR